MRKKKKEKKFEKKIFWVLVIGFLNLVSVDAKERSKVYWLARIGQNFDQAKRNSTF